MYSIDIDSSKKLFTIKGIGLYEENELLSFIDDLKSKINSIDSKDYKLVLDTSELKTSGQKTLVLMEDIITSKGSGLKS